MSTEKDDIDTVHALVEQLASDDPVVRERSRRRLVEIGGKHATRALIGELVDPRKQVRWEAAKALKAIADPASAAALMQLLDDDDQDVRWVAGEALVALGKIGLMTVLSGLIKRARSPEFCQSAHHVLHDLKEKDYAEGIQNVLKALESSEPEVTAPPVSYEALVRLKTQN